MAIRTHASALLILLAATVYCANADEEMSAIMRSTMVAIDGNRPLDSLAEGLRAYEYQAIDSLIGMRSMFVERQESAPDPPARFALQSKVDRIDVLLDKVGRQRWNASAELFWHQDLDAAAAKSAELSRPIYSLILPGSLDEESSGRIGQLLCAVLYADERVGKMLRDKFVLHWERDPLDGIAEYLPTPPTADEKWDNCGHVILGVGADAILDCRFGPLMPSEFLDWTRLLSRQHADLRGDALADFHRQRNVATWKRLFPGVTVMEGGEAWGPLLSKREWQATERSRVGELAHREVAVSVETRLLLDQEFPDVASIASAIAEYQVDSIRFQTKVDQWFSEGRKFSDLSMLRAYLNRIQATE